MRFTSQKRRQAPPVIIISLIDVLIVMLIFLMVTTTFKNQPVLKLVLPESKQPEQGTSENNVIVTIGKQAPFFYLGQKPVTYEQLLEAVRAAVKKNPDVTLFVRSDTDAPIGQYFKVLDVAKAAGVRRPVVNPIQTPKKL